MDRTLLHIFKRLKPENYIYVYNILNTPKAYSYISDICHAISFTFMGINCIEFGLSSS